MPARETHAGSVRRVTLEVRARDLLLWDGECELCRRAVRWIEERDREERFLAIPYQATPEPLVGREIKEAAAHTVHVVRTDGQVLTSGRASLYVLDALGHRWTRALTAPPLVWLVEAGYQLVSHNRHRLSRLLFHEA